MLPSWYRISEGHRLTDTVYLAEGIFHATEKYRQSTGYIGRLTARLWQGTPEMFATLTVPDIDDWLK